LPFPVSENLADAEFLMAVTGQQRTFSTMQNGNPKIAAQLTLI
jgi:hypothetical protein